MKVLLSALLAGTLLIVGYTQLGGNSETQRVLFIGNSYTYTNDLPEMVADVVGDNGIDLDVESIAIGGANLSDHAANPTVRSTIANGDFDIVILQDQSETPAIPRLLNDASLPAAEALGTMASDNGARVILFETWGHRNGSSFSGHTSYESMQTALTSGYWALASAARGTVAPVGSTWSRAIAETDVVLHSADGSHPAPAGSHLASLVIARTILGEPLTSFPTNGIPDDQANQLAALLW